MKGRLKNGQVVLSQNDGWDFSGRFGEVDDRVEKKDVATCASSLVAPVDGFLEHQVGRETKVVACCGVWCSFLALTGFFLLCFRKSIH